MKHYCKTAIMLIMPPKLLNYHFNTKTQFKTSKAAVMLFNTQPIELFKSEPG